MTADIDVLCTIFYVDDDPDDLAIFKKVAKEYGEKVCTFEFAELMLYALHHPPPSPAVILVDLNMPVKNGYEVINELKASPNLSHLPIVVYSTADEANVIERCRKLGASYYITKPRKIADIKKAIEHLLSIDWENFKPGKENFVYQAGK